MLHLRTETWDESLDLVIAGIEIGYVVLAVSIRLDDPAASKLRLSDSQAPFSYERASNIVNYSTDDSPWSLRQESVLEQNE
jgi:hypothetical protein